MIKVKANSLIHSISPVMQVTDTFQKRELVLNDSWERDGERHSNFVVVEWIGERMALLDAFAPGQRVTFEAAVNGRESKDTPGRFFTTLRGMTITPYQPQQVATTQAQYQAPQQGYQQPVQQYQQAPAPTAYPQQGYQQPMYPQQPQQVAQYPQPNQPPY